jgi:hypothetical protein
MSDCYIWGRAWGDALALRLPERTTPERRYLHAKWAALLSFDRTVAALEEVFPLQTNHSTVVRHAALTPLAPLSQVGRGGYPEGGRGMPRRQRHACEDGGRQTITLYPDLV